MPSIVFRLTPNISAAFPRRDHAIAHGFDRNGFQHRASEVRLLLGKAAGEFVREFDGNLHGLFVTIARKRSRKGQRWLGLMVEGEWTAPGGPSQ
jgi:hypothetical protein